MGMMLVMNGIFREDIGRDADICGLDLSQRWIAMISPPAKNLVTDNVFPRDFTIQYRCCWFLKIRNNGRPWGGRRSWIWVSPSPFSSFE